MTNKDSHVIDREERWGRRLFVEGNFILNLIFISVFKNIIL